MGGERRRKEGRSGRALRVRQTREREREPRGKKG